MKSLRSLVRANRRLAKIRWAELSPRSLSFLKELTQTLGLSIAAGDLQILNGNWYVTHAGLLRLSQRQQCRGIRTELEFQLSSPVEARWIFKATVYTRTRTRGFTGYGDADPTNVSPLVRGAEMRIAETRAVNRALRKAYGIGLCSVEELGWEPRTYSPADQQKPTSGPNTNGHRNGNLSLRDRLCLLIRQHQLDATLVKAYAADSCGTPNLRDATREQIEAFITNLADWAAKDRPALLCKLNSYATSQEVTS
jgi:hypothetical protein